MATFSDRLALLITGDASGYVRAVTEAGAAGKKAALETQQSTTAAGNALAKFGISTGAAVAAGATVAGAAIGKFALDAVAHFEAVTNQVRAFQRVTGASAEDSSRLVATFNVLGVDSDRVGTAIFRLAKNLDGNQAKLAGYGVQIAHTADGNIDLANTFLNIADAAEKAGAGQQADAIAAAAFGARVAKDLLPVLLRGRDGLQQLFDEAARHHEVFSQADLEKGRQLTLATNQLKEAFGGLQVEAGQALVPFITALVTASEDLLGFIDKLGRVPLVARFFRGLSIELDYISGHAKSAGTDMAAAAKQAADAAQAAQTQLERERSVIDGLSGAMKAYRTSTEAITSAQDALKKAQEEVSQKTKDEIDANYQAQFATEDLAQAEKDLIAAQKQAPIDLAKSRFDLADATIKAEQADRDALVALEKFGKGSLDARAAAQAAADAHGQVADAAQKAADAEAAATNPKDVLDAERRIAEAKKAQADAAEAKRKADAEDPVGDIAKAEQNLKDAEDDRLSTYGKLLTAIGNFNTEMGTTVSLQDALSGSVQGMLNNLQEFLNEQQAIPIDKLVPQPLPPGTLGPNHYAPELVPQALPPGTVGPTHFGPPGSGAPAPEMQSSAGNTLVIQNFNVTTTATADDIGNELAFLMRSHF